MSYSSNEEKKESDSDDNGSLLIDLRKSLKISLPLQSNQDSHNNNKYGRLSDVKPLTSIKRNASDGITISNAMSKETYKVRLGRIEDSDQIFKLLDNTWPGMDHDRDSKFWTKQFLQNTSTNAFVIEQTISSKTNRQNKQQYSSTDDRITQTSKNNNNQQKIIGFALYQWHKPEIIPDTDWSWYQTDFPSSAFQTGNADNDNPLDTKNNQLLKCNINLNKHFDKFHSHFIHFTDIAIDPKYRGKGLGTQLVQTIIYSFPKKTKFGLEVETTNISAIKCYSKCGFQIMRLVPHYYGFSRNCHKMTLLSDYNKLNMNTFFEQCAAKNKQIELDSLKDIMLKLQSKDTGYDDDDDYAHYNSCYSDDDSDNYGYRDDEEEDILMNKKFITPPSLALNGENKHDDNERVFIFEKNYDNEHDKEDEKMMNNILIQLDLNGFKQDFKKYGINYGNLSTLSVDVLPFVIPVESLRIKFEKWLIDYQTKK